MIGKVLDGRYRIVAKIGEGGMGTVYEAVHVDLGRHVAVKLVAAVDLEHKKHQVARFQREARAAGSIETMHICQVLDTGTDPDTGRPYMVMELMRGEDLARLVSRVGALDPGVAVTIAMQACRGLVRAHEAGVVHRDIKPANVFLAEQDDEVVVAKLLDFGIAKMLEPGEGQDSTLTRPGALMGSPLYMSPEQARGRSDIDARADVYSLGVVLYRMLCGRAPFQDVEAFGDLIMSICSGPVPPVQGFAAWVPAAVAELVHRALRTHRDDRYQSASELLAALKALAPEGGQLTKGMLVGVDGAARSRVATKADVPRDERAISGTQTGLGLAHTRAPAPAASRRTTLLLAAGAAVALGALGIYRLVSPLPGPPGPPSPATRGSDPAAASVATDVTSAPPTGPVSVAATTPAASTAPAVPVSASAAATASAVAPSKPVPKPSAASTRSAAPRPPDDDFGGRK